MTTNTNPHILISGGGIAGHALALQLVRSGIRTTVVERADTPRPGGQAVDLRGASREVAERMGLMPGIRARLLHELGLSYVDGAGRVFGRMSMEDFDGKGAVAEIEIARGDLDEVLRDRLAAVSAAAPGLLDLRYGDRITAITQDADGVDVAFEHAPDERFDLVVGADGVHSATRRLAFGPEEEVSTYLGGYMAFFTMPTPADVEPGWFSMRFVPGATFGIRPDFDPSTSKAIITLRVDRDPALRGDRAAQKALVRRSLEGAGWHASTVLDAMPAASDFYFDELARIDVAEPANGRVVLVGDAAACGSPMSGMGTATALIGAYLLAARIAETPGDPVAAARQYASDLAPFAEAGKHLMGGGIERMVPANRFEALMSRAMTGLMLSKPVRPIVKRMFAANQAELPLPVTAPAPVHATPVE
ncbi:2-polyprenyl-6-methoxyphenol hydroxylase-like FAD-dependent oxidoreductase [Agromyces cerinus]|uniref:FAD-dependent monooxygenase n=1 Tax=Agromyces cerinus TaxID=33878 RepID=UPI00195ACBEC|nr:FAD-dependent monooxygenase [Agromyces cerinus]MBM7832238.1 2-polyprenyl-6-methoxyphenol hydroxylase-like FAD-dependent oxidoreductase [Agromyces cerinus]